VASRDDRDGDSPDGVFEGSQAGRRLGDRAVSVVKQQMRLLREAGIDGADALTALWTYRSKAALPDGASPDEALAYYGSDAVRVWAVLGSKQEESAS
jgi:hypothetical protein